MNKTFFFLSLVILMIACQNNSNKKSLVVNDAAELQNAIENAKAGDEIVLANGIWKDVQIKFTGQGTENNPIILRAETAGEVFIEGESDLKFGGEFLEAHDLYFRNGYTPSRAVIEFRIDKDQLANHCRVTNSVIEGFNQLKRDNADLWVAFWGRHNQLDHCYIAGKSNRGPTIRVNISGNESIRNYHQIVNNHFGPRPRKGGPSGETIQIGVSSTSMSPSHTMVANNLFEKCNGEVEVISSKTNFNEFRNNFFYKCEGSLVTRHGNYCVIDGNYFIGDDNSNNIGGIRIINTGHWVTNNYFYNLKGENFRSPLAVMNGIPKSPLNRYNQVTDVVVAHNTWINSTSPWQFGVGTNVSQKDVLPLSEIRSATPIRTVVANNIIYNEKGDKNPIVAHDKIDGVTFKNNIINNQNVGFEKIDGLEANSIQMNKVNEFIYVPKENQANLELYAGFEFETIEKDIFGNSRKNNNSVGAICQNVSDDPMILDKKKYGTSWYSNEKPEVAAQTLVASSGAGDLSTKIGEANEGDIVELTAGTYDISRSLVIDKKITIRSKDKNNKAIINYSGAEQTPVIEMHPKGNLNIQHVILNGNGEQYAFASLKENMSSLYNLYVSDCEISNFNYVLKGIQRNIR